MRRLEDIEEPASVVQKSLELALHQNTFRVGLLSSLIEDFFLNNIAWEAQAHLPKATPREKHAANEA